MNKVNVGTPGHCDWSKWSWMMNWCKEECVPPANESVWKQAEEAYENHIIKQSKTRLIIDK